MWRRSQGAELMPGPGVRSQASRGSRRAAPSPGDKRTQFGCNDEEGASESVTHWHLRQEKKAAVTEPDFF